LSTAVKVVLIGAGQGGFTVYKTLRDVVGVDILGVADINPFTPAMVMAKEDRVKVVTDFRELLSNEEIDVIVESTSLDEVRQQIQLLKNPKTIVIESKAAELMMHLIKEKEELLEIKKVKGELSAILNSVHEAIEVADNNGVIRYVNPAFSRVTGISESTRIGLNIYDVSPDGALALALKEKKKFFGYRTKVGGTNVEVVSNAAPIIIDGKIEGAVVVFHHLTDMMNLMEELRKSSSIIENLNEKLGQITSSKYTFGNLFGSNEELKKTIEVAKMAAKSNSTVLVLGESGTGKEIFAHAIHYDSNRKDHPFIKVNCAAIPETLLESEFFGYEKGAFTGAVKTKIGKFELANDGTIFLDEIGDMNLYLQAKLLRVLQEMEIERIGATQSIKIDVRVIAATNRDLKEMIRKGEFREDLYYRLNVVELKIPPLRRRLEDLPTLVNMLIVKFNRKLGRKVKGLSPLAEKMMMNYQWPGNIRELENIIERAMVTNDEDIITQKHLGQYLEHHSGGGIGINGDDEISPLEDLEKIEIIKALNKFGGTVEGKKKAANALKISLATLYNKFKRYNIE
jgi:PAS domain S-box-containing protein